MGFPYTLLGALLLLIPACARDVGYKLFAKHRGAIWKRVKRTTGMGDTYLVEHRDKMVGLVEPLDPGWGFRIDGGGGGGDGELAGGGDDDVEAKPLVGSEEEY